MRDKVGDKFAGIITGVALVRPLRRAGRDLRAGDGAGGDDRRRLLAVPRARAPPARRVDAAASCASATRWSSQSSRSTRTATRSNSVCSRSLVRRLHSANGDGERTDQAEVALVDERVALETRLQNEQGELSEARAQQYERRVRGAAAKLAALFKQTADERERITVMLELMRILENRLVYLQNFIVDADVRQPHPRAAGDAASSTRSPRTRSVLTNLEATYYRAVAALYAGDVATARDGVHGGVRVRGVRRGERHQVQVVRDPRPPLARGARLRARRRSCTTSRCATRRTTTSPRRRWRSKALNSYALGEHDEALHLFQESLQLFDPTQPFFNSYFYPQRAALLRRDPLRSPRLRRRGDVLPQRAGQRRPEFVRLLRCPGAPRPHRLRAGALRRRRGGVRARRRRRTASARTSTSSTPGSGSRARTSKPATTAEARPYLEKIAATEVRYEKKPQAVELLQKIA